MTSTKQSVRDAYDPCQSIQWNEDSPIAGKHETRGGEVEIRHGHFRGGPSDNVEVVTIDSGAAVVWVLPTRGMSIWKIDCGGIRFGWDSPVAGPVHPDRVPIDDASGIGWLEGFDELLVRCGLESNGAAQFDDHRNVQYPLHGRIANLPAASLGLEIDPESGRIELSGTVIESRLFFKRLRLDVRIRMTAGSASVDVLDDVTNDLSVPATMQMLYHINVGSPVLDEGATVLASATSIRPRDETAAAAFENWQQCGPPQAGFAEQVYFVTPKAEDNDFALAMLQSSNADAALAVHYCLTGLPHLSLWKNTAAISDGYVVGLEPATGWPLQHDQESAEGRLVDLAPGETKSFRLKILPLTDEESVAEMAQKISRIQADTPIQTHDL